MDNLRDEIQDRFDRFETAWQSELATVAKDLGRAKDIYFESYLQLVSLNVWRNELFPSAVSADGVLFFLEAQNDGLVSHVLARIGSWRSALKSLRSCLENTAFGLYFNDHPVELRLWNAGRYKPSFASTVGYLEKHPALDGIQQNVSGLDVFQKEYGTLSKAVHGSVPFQMTAETGATSLWTSSLKSLKQWRTRERVVIQSVNLLLLALISRTSAGHEASSITAGGWPRGFPGKIPSHQVGIRDHVVLGARSEGPRGPAGAATRTSSPWSGCAGGDAIASYVVATRTSLSQTSPVSHQIHYENHLHYLTANTYRRSRVV
jgi:hypothetical protein